jgi:opacity protein-like surface antigen
MVSLSAGLLLLLSPASPAETRIGVAAGPNLAKFSGSLIPNEITFSGATNAGVGAVVEVDVSRRVSLSCTPTLLQKGSHFSGWGSASDTTGTVDMTYLELPLLARYGFGSSGLRPYLTAGPTLGFRRTATITQVERGDLPVTEDIKEITQGVDLGLAVGAGVEIPAGRFGFFVEGRYTVGLLPVQDVPPGWTYSFERGPFNRGLFLSLGATFALGR